MKDIKKITSAVLGLFLDIGGIFGKTIRNSVLPNRLGKGNLISSLYVFFVGTMEILNRFEIDKFHMTNLFRRKHIKRGIIVSGILLFLLSSLEWAPDNQLGSNFLCFKTEEVLPVKATDIPTAVEHESIVNKCLQKGQTFAVPARQFCLLISPFGQKIPEKRFLLIRCILI